MKRELKLILSVASNSKGLESYQSKLDIVLKSLKYQLIYLYDRIREIISYKVIIGKLSNSKALSGKES